MSAQEIEGLKEKIEILEIRYNALIRYIKNINPKFLLKEIEK